MVQTLLLQHKELDHTYLYPKALSTRSAERPASGSAVLGAGLCAQAQYLGQTENAGARESEEGRS